MLAPVAAGPLKLAADEAEKEAGDGSGAAAKSAKSVMSLAGVLHNSSADIPESPTGTGDADGLEPPKRPLMKPAILKGAHKSIEGLMFDAQLKKSGEAWGPFREAELISLVWPCQF